MKTFSELMTEYKLTIPQVIKLKAQLREHESNGYDEEIYLLFADYVGFHYATPDDFQDKYLGEWKSLADYVAEQWQEWIDEEEKKLHSHQWWHPIRFIDWEDMARNLELNGDVFTIETGYEEVHVFFNH